MRFARAWVSGLGLGSTSPSGFLWASTGPERCMRLRHSDKPLAPVGAIAPASVHSYERLTPAMAQATLLSVWQSVVSPMISMG